MKNATTNLDFTKEYIQWKLAKERVYHYWTPDEFLEECILKEKAEIFNQMWDMMSDGAEDSEIVALLRNYE